MFIISHRAANGYIVGCRFYLTGGALFGVLSNIIIIIIIIILMETRKHSLSKHTTYALPLFH